MHPFLKSCIAVLAFLAATPPALAFRDVYIAVYSCYYSFPDPRWNDCIDAGKITPIPPDGIDGIVHPYDITARQFASISATRDVNWGGDYTRMPQGSFAVTAGQSIKIDTRLYSHFSPTPVVDGKIILKAGSSITGQIGTFYDSVSTYIICADAPVVNLINLAPGQISIRGPDCSPPCKIPPLSSVADALASKFETAARNGQPPPPESLTPPLVDNDLYLKMQDLLLVASSSLKITSGFRPPAYQQHFRQLRDKWIEIMKLSGEDKLACTTLLADINKEIDTYHKLKRAAKTKGAVLAGQPLINAVSAHSEATGALGVDVGPSAVLAGVVNLDQVARSLGVLRPCPRDPVHFQLATYRQCRWSLTIQAGTAAAVSPASCQGVCPQSLAAITGAPINLMVIAADGRRIGYDPIAQKVLNDFGADASYSGVGTDTQIIDIVGDIEGDFEVFPIAVGTGQYELSMMRISEGGDVLDERHASGNAGSGTTPAKLSMFVPMALPIDSTAEKVAALYVGFFERAPDLDGLVFWKTSALNSGLSDLALMRSMAAGFANHPSFAARYGALSNAAYVDAIYLNIGGKPADAAGKAYWLGKLDGGLLSRSDVVADFVFGLLEISEDALQDLVNSGAIADAERQDALSRKYRMMNKGEVALIFDVEMGPDANLSPGTDPLNPASLAADPAYRASKNIIRSVTEDSASKEAPLKFLSGTPTIDSINAIFGP